MKTQAVLLESFFIIPAIKPTSRPPTPISPAGTSVSAPRWRYSSVISAWQKRITSPSLFPFGSKSLPPLPPPIGRVVRAFLKVCSKPRNLRMERLTDGWKRIPPLYGPMAELNCTRHARLTCTWLRSSTHTTRNWITRSGSTRRSSNDIWRYFGFCSRKGQSVVITSRTACANSV
ncbi:hypothetical protein ESCOCP365M1_20400 [Escherichia coli]|nr:hypothetical protein BvCmsHHP019_04498 [Escherichia coli]